MLQVTGHAGGVPKAALERGRSVEFPSEGNNKSICLKVVEHSAEQIAAIKLP